MLAAKLCSTVFINLEQIVHSGSFFAVYMWYTIPSERGDVVKQQIDINFKIVKKLLKFVVEIVVEWSRGGCMFITIKQNRIKHEDVFILFKVSKIIKSLFSAGVFARSILYRLYCACD